MKTYKITSSKKGFEINDLTKEEALQMLNKWASEMCNSNYFTKEEALDFAKMVIADHELEGAEAEEIMAIEWFKGNGYYNECLYPIYLDGEMSFSDNDNWYRIEEC